MRPVQQSASATRIRTGIIASLILLALGNPTGVRADEKQPLVPLPSVLDFTRGDGWALALGGSVEYEAAYDGSDEYEVGVEPAGAVQWRTGDNVFFWEGLELGWRGRTGDRWLVQTGIRYEEGLDPDDSDDGYLDGLEERDSHVVGFMEARRSFGNDWRNWVAARAMGGPSEFGWLGVIAAGHRFGSSLDGSGTELFAFVTFGTEDFINKDFGVDASDSAASGLPETHLDSGYRSVGITVIHRRDLTPRLHFAAQAGIEWYSSDIGDSPIARDDYEAEVGLSLVYRFFQSSR